MGGRGAIREWDGVGHSFCTPPGGPVPTASGRTCDAAGPGLRVTRMMRVEGPNRTGEVARTAADLRCRRVALSLWC
jgi:hypothetical protein